MEEARAVVDACVRARDRVAVMRSVSVVSFRVRLLGQLILMVLVYGYYCLVEYGSF